MSDERRHNQPNRQTPKGDETRRLDDVGAALAHVGDDPRDELDVLLYGDRHVRKYRGLPGPVMVNMLGHRPCRDGRGRPPASSHNIVAGRRLWRAPPVVNLPSVGGLGKGRC
jgi:hypothetical protein